MKKLFFLLIVFVFGCTKVDMPPSDSSASKQPEKVVLTAYAGDGGGYWSKHSLQNCISIFYEICFC